MKKIYVVVALFFLAIFTNCEDVIPVDLATDKPRLVIEASLLWQKGTLGDKQMIKLSTTGSFYSNVIPPVSGAVITVKNSSNKTFNFIEGSKPGEYNCTNFEPKINETYTLNVQLNGTTYTATETLMSVVPLENIVQNDKGGIASNRIELRTFFTDPKNEDNFYMFKYGYKVGQKDDFFVDDDISFQGNKYFSLNRNNELKKGDEVVISHYGISGKYFNFMKILIEISGRSGGAPFSTPPATVKGNIINKTNLDDYPLGFFNLSEYDTTTYIVK